MRNRMMVLGSLIAVLGTTVSAGVLAQNPSAPIRSFAGKRHRTEKHPELARALKALERAKMDLQKADRDFGGHRAKAQQLTDEAMREVHEAMKFDKN